MARNESKALQEKLTEILDIKIEYLPMKSGNQDYFAEFLEARKSGDINKDVSVVEYIQQKYSRGDSIIIPDFSGMQISGTGGNELDLGKIDFSGCNLRACSFDMCDLSGAIFCDADLENTWFNDSYLQEADFRGCNLSNCHFMFFEQSPSRQQKMLDGIKFSGSAESFKQHLLTAEQQKTARLEQFKQEKKEFVLKEQKKIDLLKKKLKRYEEESTTYNYVFDSAKYNKIKDKIEKINTLITTGEESVKQLKQSQPDLDNDLVMHDSVQLLMSGKAQYDPAYVRGSWRSDKAGLKTYYKANRPDIEEFLSQEDEHNLKAFIASKYKLENNSELAIDLSGQDLSGLAFAECNLEAVSFAGSKLSEATFYNVSLNDCSFEGAELNKSIFRRVIAKNSNFFGTNLAEADIVNSDFRCAFMSHLQAQNMHAATSKLDYASLRFANLTSAEIEDCQLNNVDATGITLSNAVILRTNMQQSILDQAACDHIKVINSDLSNSFMREINLEHAELKEGSSLKGSNLYKAALDNMKANDCSFEDAVLDLARARYAELTKCTLNKASARYADFDSAIMKTLRAEKIDLTGANMESMQAEKANFKQAILQYARAEEANFAGTILSKAKLEGIDLKYSELSGSKVDGATIDATTDIRSANIGDVTGSFNQNGAEVSPEIHQKFCEDLYSAQHVPAWRRVAGNIASMGSSLTRAAGNFVKQPLTKKFIIAAGVVIGGAAIGYVAFAALSFAAAGIGVVAVGAAAGMAVGAVAGGFGANFASRHSGVSSLTTAAVGFGTLGPVGAAVGYGVGVAANNLTENMTGQNIDGLVSSGLCATADAMQRGANRFGISQEQQAALNAHSNDLMNAEPTITPVEVSVAREREKSNHQLRDARNMQGAKQVMGKKIMPEPKTKQAAKPKLTRRARKNTRQR